MTATKNALERIHAGEMISRRDKILIKSNYILERLPSSGVMTDGKVVDGAIKFVQQYDAEMIIGEGVRFLRYLESFEMKGVTGLAACYGVKPIDLKKKELIASFLDAYSPFSTNNSILRYNRYKSSVRSMVICPPPCFMSPFRKRLC